MKKVYESHWGYKLAFLLPLLLLLRFLIMNFSVEITPDIHDLLAGFFTIAPLLGLVIYFLIKQLTVRISVSSKMITFESIWGGKSYAPEDIQGYVVSAAYFSVFDVNDEIIHSNLKSFRKDSFYAWVVKNTQLLSHDTSEIGLRHSPKYLMVFGKVQLGGVILGTLCILTKGGQFWDWVLSLMSGPP